MKNKVLFAKLDFEEILKHKVAHRNNWCRVIQIQSEKDGNTLGHLLAKYRLKEEDYFSNDYNVIEKALHSCTKHPEISAIQNKDGNTIGHIAFTSKKIVKDYKENVDLNSIKNNDGNTVCDLYNKYYNPNFSFSEKER